MAFAQALARSPALLEERLDGFEAEARRAFASNPDALVVVADLRGQQLINTARQPGQHLPFRDPIGLAAQKRALETHATVVSDVHFGPVSQTSAVGALSARRRYLETIAAESGDVDITKHSVLVSIGRGIQEKDNVAIAEELAEALGAAVSCSRPVVDAKWMEKSRQVGSSGKTVKPKVYLACGISGAFQHLAGLKGNPFLIAINKNPKAPIFQVADVGIVDDVLEFLPELTNKVRELRGVTAK